MVSTSGLREGSFGDHHCSKTESAVVVYGLDHNGEKGEDKGAEAQFPWRLLGHEPGGTG
jgi:hypothetical protein